MTTRHHEVPTHLNVEDRVLFGLTARQFLYVVVGSSASYELWEQAWWFGDALRMASVAVCLGATLALALVRPAGRARRAVHVRLLQIGSAAESGTDSAAPRSR